MKLALCACTISLLIAKKMKKQLPLVAQISCLTFQSVLCVFSSTWCVIVGASLPEWTYKIYPSKILLTTKTIETTVMERKVTSVASTGVRRSSRGEEGRKIFSQTM
jgi:hypothetical protein